MSETQPKSLTAEQKAAEMTQPADNGQHAGEQADEYDSPFASSELKLDDGTVIKIPPDPRWRLLGADALMALDRLNIEIESYDRHPDIFIPEQKIKDTAGNEITLPSETRQGSLKENPYRKTDPDTGEVTILDPPYDVQVVQIALGADKYAKLVAGTVDGEPASVADVKRIWNERGLALAKREEDDSKSNEGSGVLEGVPAPDSE